MVDIIEKATITKSSTMLHYFCLRPKEFNVYFLRHSQIISKAAAVTNFTATLRRKIFQFCNFKFKKKIKSFPTLILARKKNPISSPIEIFGLRY